MADMSRLEQLKRQVEDTTNNQMQIQAKKDEILSQMEENKNKINENEQQMQNMINSVAFKNEIATAKEREFIKDELARFNHRQLVMNENIIKLNDNLADTSALNEVFELKRKELESSYIEQKNILENKLSDIENQIKEKENYLKNVKAKKDEKIDNILTKHFKKIAILSTILLIILFGFIYLNSATKQENNELKTRLEAIPTSTYYATNTIQLYNIDTKEKEEGFLHITNIDTFGESKYFIVLNKGDNWTNIYYQGEEYAIKTADLKANAERETINLN